MSVGLQAYQAAKRRTVVRKIRCAMLVIKGQIKTHKFYPWNGGQVTRAEICRIVHVPASTLKNPSHLKTRTMVAAFLKRLARKAPTRKPAAADAKAERIRELEYAWIETARRFNAFKIRYEELEAENAKLVKQIALLQVALAAAGRSNVVPLSKKGRS